MGWLGQNVKNGNHNNYKMETVFPNVYEFVEFGSSWNRVLFLCTEFVYIITESIIGFKLQQANL